MAGLSATRLTGRGGWVMLVTGAICIFLQATLLLLLNVNRLCRLIMPLVYAKATLLVYLLLGWSGISTTPSRLMLWARGRSPIIGRTSPPLGWPVAIAPCLNRLAFLVTDALTALLITAILPCGIFLN